MKIGPDGSLPRITSSYKGLTSSLKIIKLPEDEIGESGMVYKLVLTGENKESELSEKSDEDAWSDEDIPNANQPEKEKSVESADFSCNQSMVESESYNREFERWNRNKRDHKNRFKGYGKRNNTRGSFNKSNLMASGCEERKNFNQNKRGFRSSGNYGKNYNQPLKDTPSPWVIPPIIPMLPTHQFGTFAPYMSQNMNPIIQAPSNTTIDNSVTQNPNPVGLLGHSPYTAPPSYRRRLDFQQNKEFSSHPTGYQASSNNDGFHQHPLNYQPSNNNDKFDSPPLNYPANNNNDGFHQHPLNYQPSNNNDEFGSSPLNYPANSNNDNFISHPPNYEANNESNEYIPPPSNYHQSKQNNKFRQNRFDKYNFPHSYGNDQRIQHGHGQFNRRNNYARKNWRKKNRQHPNNYNRHQSYRAHENDKRNANGHFDCRN